MFIYNDYKGFKIWSRYYIQKFCPPFLYPILLNYFYRKTFQKNINLKHPKTFSEKLNYLKIKDVTKQKTELTDKLFAKKYIQQNFPELKTAKLYQVCSTFEEINFSLLPKTFLIKTNHACKTGILIEDKDKITDEEYNRYKNYFKKVLKINYAFWGTLELQYKDIKPMIYVEEYLQSKTSPTFLEYEVYCFNGNPMFIQCHNFNGKHINNFEFGVSFFNTNWDEAGFSLICKRDKPCSPSHLNRKKILEFAKKLSKDFKFARVDIFEINKKLYFGEITFTPFTGDIKFCPEEYDLTFGEMLLI